MCRLFKHHCPSSRVFLFSIKKNLKIILILKLVVKSKEINLSIKFMQANLIQHFYRKTSLS